jgi:hypothetical protein
VIDRTAPSNNGDRLSDRSATTSPSASGSTSPSTGSVTSFVSDSDALSYAVSLETAACVSERQLDDVASLQGKRNAVADNGDPGTNHDDEPPSRRLLGLQIQGETRPIQLYYFDKALLDEAIRFYAKGYVQRGPNTPTAPTIRPAGSVYDGRLDLWRAEPCRSANNYVLTNGRRRRLGHSREGRPRAPKGRSPSSTETALGEQLKESGVWAVTEDRQGRQTPARTRSSSTTTRRS